MLSQSAPDAGLNRCSTLAFSLPSRPYTVHTTVLSHGCDDFTMVAFDVAPDQRQIFLVNVVFFKLRRKIAVRVIGFCRHDEAGRVLIQTVYNARTQDTADAG